MVEVKFALAEHTHFVLLAQEQGLVTKLSKVSDLVYLLYEATMELTVEN